MTPERKISGQDFTASLVAKRLVGERQPEVTLKREAVLASQGSWTETLKIGYLAASKVTTQDQ